MNKTVQQCLLNRLTIHVDHSVLLRSLYQRIVLLLCLAHGILQIALLNQETTLHFRAPRFSPNGEHKFHE